MSKFAIEVENLSKRYRIGARENNKTLREAFVDLAAAPLRRIKSFGRSSHREEDSIWALKDVSFEVEPGEVVGIIGRNGAGKTTLLKVLSQITEPTEGRAVLNGRVASLLEVGTGFHTELTGRENIYLSGALLGMSKKEIDKKFDEIVDFSGVDKFIDTPVKRYSSGMRVRLGFAVAAHLEPEILLIDEVLAVGDAAFQAKCLGKMGEVAKEGRTVLFVSHNMSAITRLCKWSVWLEAGRIRDIAPASRIVERYLLSGSDRKPETAFDVDPGKDAQYRAVRVLNAGGVVSPELSCDEPITLELVYEVRKKIPGLYLTFYLRNAEGIFILFSDWKDCNPNEVLNLQPGTHVFSICIPPRILGAGTYFLTVGSATGGGHVDHRRDVCTFSLHDTLTPRGDSRVGAISARLQWRRGSLADKGLRLDTDGI